MSDQTAESFLLWCKHCGWHRVKQSRRCGDFCCRGVAFLGAQGRGSSTEAVATPKPTSTTARPQTPTPRTIQKHPPRTMANMSSNTNTANTTHSQCSATTDTNHQCQNDTHTSKATGMPTHKQEEAQRQITHEHWMATSIVFLQMLFIDLRWGPMAERGCLLWRWEATI